MLSDGLYGVHFKTPKGEGAGVLILANGQLRGGDSSLAYIGTVSQTGQEFSARVATRRHAPGLASVFGKDVVNISLVGKSTGNGGSCTGTAAEAPGLTFQATLTKIED